MTQKHPDGAQEVAVRPGGAANAEALHPQALISQAIAAGAPIETLERLVALAKDVAAAQAKAAWYQAMAEFQKRCPPIRKTATGDAGRYRWTYAPADEIMSTISPVMGPLGLSVRYRIEQQSGAVSAVAIVSHELGHSEESGAVTVPIGAGDPDKGAPPAQRIGIARSYACRYALLSAIGMVPEDADTQAAPVVAQPRRRSQPPPSDVREAEVIDTQTDLPDAQPEQLGDGQPREARGGTWRGRIARVTEQSGATIGVPWTVYRIEGHDGAKYSTFSASYAEFARTSMSGKKPAAVDIAWEPTAKGGKKITAIELAGA